MRMKADLVVRISCLVLLIILICCCVYTRNNNNITDVTIEEDVCFLTATPVPTNTPTPAPTATPRPTATPVPTVAPVITEIPVEDELEIFSTQQNFEPTLYSTYSELKSKKQHSSTSSPKVSVFYLKTA